MSLEIKGKLKFVKALEPVTGQGQNGEWKKARLCNYKQMINILKMFAFTVWGDKTDYFT